MSHRKYPPRKWWLVFGLYWLTIGCHSILPVSKGKDATSHLAGGSEPGSSMTRNLGRGFTKSDSATARLSKSAKGITTDERSFFLTKDHAISLFISPDEQSQSVTCTIVDCTTTVIKPIILSSGDMNFFIGTATISATFEKVAQKGLINGKQVDEAHAKSSVENVAKFSPISLGNILNLGFTLTTKVDRIKKPEKPKGTFENFSCQMYA